MEFRMTAITAKDNPSIQLYRKLVRQRKARTQNQQFVRGVSACHRCCAFFKETDPSVSDRSSVGTLSGRILLFRG